MLVLMRWGLEISANGHCTMMINSKVSLEAKLTIQGQCSRRRCTMRFNSRVSLVAKVTTQMCASMFPGAVCFLHIRAKMRPLGQWSYVSVCSDIDYTKAHVCSWVCHIVSLTHWCVLQTKRTRRAPATSGSRRSLRMAERHLHRRTWNRNWWKAPQATRIPCNCSTRATRHACDSISYEH